jgi:hypothetical protein
MPNGATAAGTAAAIAQAIKASGAIVNVDPDAFLTIIGRGDNLAVVIAEGGIFRKNYKYLTAYKGLFFFTKSSTPLQLPSRIELITARTIWIPG